jgi:hypothetical protein
LQAKQAISEPGWAANGDLSVHLVGEKAQCSAGAAAGASAETSGGPLVMNTLLGTFLSGGALPKLRVKYCLNDACVSPRFMGSGALLTAPTLSDEDVWNYRRLQKVSLRSELVLGPGVITGLRYTSDTINDRVMQRGFYNSLAVLSTVEPPVRIPAERRHIEIPPLPSQVVLIAPPVILQRRSKEIPCQSILAADISDMLAQQLERKCSASYICEAPTALSERLRCFDREVDEVDEQYFGEEPKRFGDRMVYADFANMLRETSILKNGEMLSVDNWIDQKTGAVELIAVFSIAYNSITTVLRMTWEKSKEDGSGRFSGRSTVLSYKNIPPDELGEFWFYIITNMILNVADIITISILGWRRKRKKDYLLSMATGRKDAQSTIRSSVTVLSRLDAFDLIMRLGMMYLCVQFFNQKTYSATSYSPLDKQGHDLMTIDWIGPEGREQNDQFTILFRTVSSIDEGQQRELFLRQCAFFTLFFMLVRVVIYMNCHPRIAVLYGTIVNSLDDLFHFSIVFMVIFLCFRVHGLVGYRFGER